MIFEPKQHIWTGDDEEDIQWTWSLQSDDSLLLSNSADDQRIRVTQDGEFRFYGTGGLYLNDSQLPGQGITVDADTLDGYTSSQFGVLAENETATGVWNFQNGVQSRGSFVLTQQDETAGNIDAGTVDGLDVEGIRPDIQASGTTIEDDPEILNFTGSLEATQTTDGTVDIDVTVPDQIADSRVNVREEGTEVVHYATDLDFEGSQFAVSNPSGQQAKIDIENPGVDVKENGSTRLSDAISLNFGNHIDVTTSGTEATIDVELGGAGDTTTILGVDRLGFSGGGDRIGTIESPDYSNGALRFWNPHTGVEFFRLSANNTHLQNVPIEFEDAGDGVEYGAGTSSYYRYTPYRENLGGLSGGSSLPYTQGSTLETDTQLALVETDADRVMGWFSSATNSLTIEKIRTGDLGGAPNEALDVRGNITMQGEFKNFRLENRTSDPSNPSVGRMWIRTDV